MKHRLSWFLIALTCLIAMAYTLCSPRLPTASYAASPQFRDGQFRNPVPRHALGFGTVSYTHLTLPTKRIV